MTSLNPVFRIGDQVDEVTRLHNPEMSAEAVKARTLEMLDLVGIANKEGVYKMYPHELSGGMRQRVMIAIALACSPTLIIADEPTTALDVTIQAQILDLLQNLKDKLNSSIMLITHDLGVVAGMADHVVVMYAGTRGRKGHGGGYFPSSGASVYHRPDEVQTRAWAKRWTSCTTFPAAYPIRSICRITAISGIAAKCSANAAAANIRRRFASTIRMWYPAIAIMISARYWAIPNLWMWRNCDHGK